MWEDGPWFIDENHEVSPDRPCKHCNSKRVIVHTRPMDGSEFYTTAWTCPAVVIVENEGGYNSTGLCLDCLLEVAGTIRPQQS